MELENYNEAVSTIKQAILQSQYRAAKLVTGEQAFSLFWHRLLCGGKLAERNMGNGSYFPYQPTIEKRVARTERIFGTEHP